MLSEHCREFDDRSQELTSLDQLLADPRLTEHAQNCAPCSARRTEMVRLQTAVNALRNTPLPVDLTGSVLQKWRSGQQAGSATAKPSPLAGAQETAAPETTSPAAARPASRTVSVSRPVSLQAAPVQPARLTVPAAEPEQSRPATLLALATSVAVLLLAAVTLNSVQDSRPGATGQQLAAAGSVQPGLPGASSTGAEQPADLRAPQPARLPALQPVPLDRLVWNAGNAWVGLTSATMTEVTASALATTGTGSRTDSPDSENSDAAWLRELEGTLGPVRDDLSRTVQFLFETLPLSDASTI